MTNRKYLIGIDVGTTGANAMVFDAEGNTYGSGYREYSCFYPEEKQVEQDAEELVQSTFQACREAVKDSGIDPADILAISLSSQRATFGLLDAEKKIIGGNFYSWQDNRAVSEIPDIESMIAPERLYRITGMPLTPTYSLEKLLWIKKHQSDRYEKTERIVFVNDYIFYRFGTQDFYSEITSACCSGMIDVNQLGWSDEILDLFEIDRGKLSSLVKPGEIVGHLSQNAAQKTGLHEGTLLVAGTGDQQCAAIGAGVVDEGLGSLTLGTAGLLVVGTRQLDLEKSPGLMAPSSGCLGLYELEGIQLGAASCYRWMRDIAGSTEKQLAEETNGNSFELMEQHLQISPPGANGVVFLPFLSGAGYPLWDPQAQGMFVGLRFSHSRSDMIRAVMEGITLESGDMYQKMKLAGVTIKSLTITGGATKSPAWRQMIADVFNTPIRHLQVPDATLVGSAIFAGMGAGVFRDVKHGVEKMVRFSETIQPIPRNVEIYHKSYKVYQRIYHAMKSQDIFTQIAGLH